MIEITAILTKIIIFSGLGQGLYSAMVLTHGRFKNPANNYLAILMLILSASIVHSVFVVPYMFAKHQETLNIREPFLFLVIPFFWFYVKKLEEPEFKFRRKHLLHFIPFMCVMLASLALLSGHHFKNNLTFHIHSLVLNILLSLAALIQYVFYLVYILKLIGRFKLKVFNEVSNTENIDPLWMKVFLVTFLIVFIFMIAMMFIALHQINSEYFNNLLSVVFAISVYVMGYKGLFQQTVLIQNTIQVNDVGKTKTINENTVDEVLLNKLLVYMDHQKPFQDPELTLTVLASRLEIGRNQLSDLINKGTGGNFYEFVNKYRVDEVKELMSDPRFKDYTLLAIAFEAGFPSKSTFNSIFKKFTGYTPSDYKRINKI